LSLCQHLLSSQFRVAGASAPKCVRRTPSTPQCPRKRQRRLLFRSSLGHMGCAVVADGQHRAAQAQTARATLQTGEAPGGLQWPSFPATQFFRFSGELAIEISGASNYLFAQELTPRRPSPIEERPPRQFTSSKFVPARGGRSGVFLRRRGVSRNPPLLCLFFFSKRNRVDRRFRMLIATSNFRVLRRPLESTQYTREQPQRVIVARPFALRKSPSVKFRRSSGSETAGQLA